MYYIYVQQISFLDIFSKLISIDSQSFKSNFEIIDFIASLFKNFEIQIQEFVNKEGVKGKNLIVKIAGYDHSRSLVFIGHTDTVPFDKNWDTNPLELTEKNDFFYGRGVCDTKGAVAALISTVLELKDKPKYDTYLLFDGDEELFFAGAKKFKENLNLKNPHFIALEPTDNALCIGARGILEFEVKTYGKAMHASLGTPEVNNENSAIYKMSAVMSALIKDGNNEGLEKDLVMGSNSQNLGIINGGIAKNIIPDFCSLIVDRRILPSKNLENEFLRLKQLILNIDPKAIVTKTHMENGFYTDQNSAFVTNLLGLLKIKDKDFKVGSFTAMSEVAVFSNLGDCVILGPGSIQQAHQVNEFISKKELLDFKEIFKNIILNIKL